jgi:serine/threonine protein kinase
VASTKLQLGKSESSFSILIGVELQLQVIGSKTKIYMVMEYISGGQLADKLVRIIQVAASAIPRVSVSFDISNPVHTLFTQSYAKKLNEPEARKIFHQLIDAVDYCHTRGVYHRDLKVKYTMFFALFVNYLQSIYTN